jgi:glycosyltransferase involved in cell wall biosynthesis
MKLSILILTHNRPKLFKRCLESVLDQITPNVEILVNNDSCDIEEIDHPQVKYYYCNPNSLCEIYKFLLEQSQGEYVYYLEDDDYLTKDFLSIKLDADLIVGNYYPTYKTADILISMTMYKDAEITSQQFITNLNTEHLQLSQHIYTRSHIADFDFPMDSNIHNDIRLTLHAASKTKTIHTLNKVFFYQSTDGGDNISFPESISRVNITKSLNFLEKYEIFGTTPRTTRS